MASGEALTAFEVARATRIAYNEARMVSMGLQHAKKALASVSAGKKPKSSGGARIKRKITAVAEQGAPRRSLRQAGVESAPCVPRTCDLPEDAAGSVPATAAALKDQLGLPRAAARQLVMLSSAHLTQATPTVLWNSKWEGAKHANPEDYHDANRARLSYMSDKQLRKRIRSIRDVAKMESFVVVIHEQGRDDLLKEAQAALAALLAPPTQPALTSTDEASAKGTCNGSGKRRT